MVSVSNIYVLKKFLQITISFFWFSVLVADCYVRPFSPASAFKVPMKLIKCTGNCRNDLLAHINCEGFALQLIWSSLETRILNKILWNGLLSKRPAWELIRCENALQHRKKERKEKPKNNSVWLDRTSCVNSGILKTLEPVIKLCKSDL